MVEKEKRTSESRNVGKPRRWLLVVLVVLSLLALCAWALSSTGSAVALEPSGETDESTISADERKLAPLSAEAQAWVEETMNALDRRERLAQLILPWVPGEIAGGENATEFKRMIEWVERDRVGGLIISRGSSADIRRRLARAQSRARVPLLVVSDLETGPGMRIRPGGTEMPPAMAIGAAGEERLARAAGAVTAREARAVGIHLTLGPILDVNTDPGNPIINVRAFGDNPSIVSRMGAAWSEGAQEAGLGVVPKHFPGHGDTRVDSHVGLPVLRADRARMGEVELPPFQYLEARGVEGILVGHLAAPSLEKGDSAGVIAPKTLPATLSPDVMSILRDEWGFEGLIITDALNMGAITEKYGVAEASIQALIAGADLLLQPPGHRTVLDALERAMNEGRLSEQRVNESVRRVLEAKARIGLNESREPPAVSNQGTVGEHERVASEIAEASLTLVRDERSVLPLRRKEESGVKKILHLVYTPAGRSSTGRVLTEELQSAGFVVERQNVGESISGASLQRLTSRSREVDLVLISVAVSPHQGRSLGWAGRFPRWVEERATVRETPLVVVSLGSPYLLPENSQVSGLLLAWSNLEVSERAVARALIGEIPIRGTLPITLSSHHRQGFGLVR